MILLILAVLFVLLNGWLVTQPTRTGVWVTKPAVMILLIAWVLSQSSFPAFLNAPGTSPLVWFLLGLIFSLAGDIFLMLGTRYLPWGVGAFALTHLFYILGFGQIPPARAVWFPAAVMAAFLLIGYVFLISLIFSGLETRAQPKAKAPAALYLLLVSLTLYSALLSWFDYRWEASASLLAVCGAALFFPLGRV